MESEYYHTKESVQEYIELAKDVNGGELIEILKSFLPANSSILELGSGPGTDWKILSRDYNVTGSDLSLEFLNHLRSSNPNGTFIEVDAITIQTEQKYDGIYSNKVLHHLKDDELAACVNRQVQVLNADGIICHSFWKGEGSEVFKGMFVNYHTEVSLKKLFGAHFEILYIDSYAEFEEGDSILLIGKRKEL